MVAMRKNSMKQVVNEIFFLHLWQEDEVVWKNLNPHDAFVSDVSSALDDVMRVCPLS